MKQFFAVMARLKITPVLTDRRQHFGADDEAVRLADSNRSLIAAQPNRRQQNTEARTLL